MEVVIVAETVGKGRIGAKGGEGGGENEDERQREGATEGVREAENASGRYRI